LQKIDKIFTGLKILHERGQNFQSVFFCRIVVTVDTSAFWRFHAENDTPVSVQGRIKNERKRAVFLAEQPTSILCPICV
jgi:hypothetical protein